MQHVNQRQNFTTCKGQADVASCIENENLKTERISEKKKMNAKKSQTRKIKAVDKML